MFYPQLDLFDRVFGRTRIFGWTHFVRAFEWLLEASYQHCRSNKGVMLLSTDCLAVKPLPRCERSFQEEQATLGPSMKK